jgi:hypothetical protein
MPKSFWLTQNKKFEVEIFQLLTMIVLENILSMENVLEWLYTYS